MPKPSVEIQTNLSVYSSESMRFILFSRHKEPAGSLIFWAPEEPRRRGRPNTTLLDVLKSDTGLNNDELRAAMTDRSIWKTNFIMSPD